MKEKLQKAIDQLAVKTINLECSIAREFNPNKKNVLKARHKELKSVVHLLIKVKDEDVSLEDII